jgi:preprotein translocase subunit SecG
MEMKEDRRSLLQMGGKGMPKKGALKKRKSSGGGFGSYGDAGRTSIVGNGGRVLGCGTSMVITAVIVFVVVLVLAFMFTSMNKNSGNVAKATVSSTINRTKLANTEEFNSNCIKDELEWIDDVATTENGLEPFYKKTGIQPYIIFRGYDATLSSDEEKEEWANTYFSENISDQNAFLFVYFAEKNTTSDMGYMCTVSGASADAVMDSEAMSLYWDNISRYWASDLSTDQMLIQSYSDTATRIMKHHTTPEERTRNIIILVVVLIVLAAAAFFYKGRGDGLLDKLGKKRKGKKPRKPKASSQKKRPKREAETLIEDRSSYEEEDADSELEKTEEGDYPLLTEEEIAEIRKKLGL